MSVIIREKDVGDRPGRSGGDGPGRRQLRGQPLFRPRRGRRTACSGSPSGRTPARTRGPATGSTYHGPDGATVANVAWVYDQPKPGHEAIKDRYGFYAGKPRPDPPGGLTRLAAVGHDGGNHCLTNRRHPPPLRKVRTMFRIPIGPEPPALRRRDPARLPPGRRPRGAGPARPAAVGSPGRGGRRRRRRPRRRPGR